MGIASPFFPKGKNQVVLFISVIYGNLQRQYQRYVLPFYNEHQYESN